MFSLWSFPYDPKPAERPYVGRAQTKADEHAEVSVAILTHAECKTVFGVPLANRGLQAVWVRVVNRSPTPTRVLMTKIAANYYTAREAAGVCHFSMLKRLVAFGIVFWFFLPIIGVFLPFKLFAIRRANRRMNECFQTLGFPLKNMKPGAVAEGIVFTPMDFGTRVVNVAMLMSTGVKDYFFNVEIPGAKVDYLRGPARSLDVGEPVECDLKTLHLKLMEMPATTSDAHGHRTGDPVNLVIIGDFASVLGVFGSRWDQTEIITFGSCWRTVKAFIFGTEYRYSPVSALYLFRRPQSFALQRVRESINERLHLRLWSTPLRFEGKEVWVGQVSRDIGVRFTLRTWNLTTHQIDPDVDEARDYVMEDLFEAGRLSQGGFVAGVGPCTREAARYNLTGDPYYTDGQRAVAIVSEERTIPKLLHWN